MSWRWSLQHSWGQKHPRQDGMPRSAGASWSPCLPCLAPPFIWDLLTIAPACFRTSISLLWAAVAFSPEHAVQFRELNSILPSAGCLPGTFSGCRKLQNTQCHIFLRNGTGIQALLPFAPPSTVPTAIQGYTTPVPLSSSTMPSSSSHWFWDFLPKTLPLPGDGKLL